MTAMNDKLTALHELAWRQAMSDEHAAVAEYLDAVTHRPPARLFEVISTLDALRTSHERVASTSRTYLAALTRKGMR